MIFNAMRQICTLLLLFVFPCVGLAQDCEADEISIVIHFKTDQYAHESSWDLRNGQGQILAAQSDFDNTTEYKDTLCFSAAECFTFTMYDSFGDGLFGTAQLELYVDGALLRTIKQFESSASVQFNCSNGQSCTSALPVTLGAYSYNASGSWLEFSPDINGIYGVSTCGGNTCDTRLWIYDGCDGLLLVDTNEGTTFYNDNSDCGIEAAIQGVMLAGSNYIIRVKDFEEACTEDSISIQYLGPIEGCMDSLACNFNSYATADDGSCLYGDSCPQPDLLIDFGHLYNTIEVKQIENNDACLINEGCMKGYGLRDVISFTTTIHNIGDADYFLGEPSVNSEQFEYDECHDHFHFDGYAEYVLYDAYGQYIPIGFKNGFCVLDLQCPADSMFKYSCGFMGISAGCSDTYANHTDCQWVDVTDVLDGDYTFVTRVNWNNAPDAIGRYEKDTLNNWAQVCINLDRSSGSLVMSLIDDCPPYHDCAGNIFGKAELDCKGECNGSAIRGDLDEDASLSSMDIIQYIQYSLEGTESNPCADLNADGLINVYDASLIMDCLINGNNHMHEDGSTSHDHCLFPAGIYDATSYCELEIEMVDTDHREMVLSLSNPSSNVIGLQLSITGIDIESIELLNEQFTPEHVHYSVEHGRIIIIANNTSSIAKSDIPVAFLKLVYGEVHDNEACISLEEIVNDKYEQIVKPIVPDCTILQVSTKEISDSELKIFPNPMQNYTLLSLEKSDSYTIQLFDASGKRVLQEAFYDDEYMIKRDQLPSGVYLITVASDQMIQRSRLIVF